VLWSKSRQVQKSGKLCRKLHTFLVNFQQLYSALSTDNTLYRNNFNFLSLTLVNVKEYSIEQKLFLCDKRCFVKHENELKETFSSCPVSDTVSAPPFHSAACSADHQCTSTTPQSSHVYPLSTIKQISIQYLLGMHR